MFGQQQQWSPGMGGGFGMQPPSMMGAAPMGASAWGQPAQEPTVYGNFLSPEQIHEMQQHTTQFPVKLSREEYMRSVCTHKLRNPNRFMLELQEDGQHRCALCGKSFQLLALDTPEEQIYGICKNMHDLIQSIKTYILDPPESLKDIYMMLGFIEKTPLLWNNAVKEFEHVTKASGITFQNTPQQNTYQLLGAILGGGMMPGAGGFGYGYGMGAPMTPPPAAAPGMGAFGQAPQNPMYQPQQQQQAAWGQPVQTPVDRGYGFSQASGAAPVAPSAYGVQGPVAPPPGYAPAANPIGYVDGQSGQPAPTQVTMTPMPASQPIQPEQPVAPAAPAVATPVNPNVQSPEKVAVAKTFTPAN